MLIRFLFLLLLICSTAMAQPPVYKDFEVDSVAEPRGGITFLTTFLQVNLRKSVPAEAQGLGGRVIVNGVVEPSGRIAQVNVIKSLRTDLDREAVRVFSLYNAWKPARKDGKAVRQQVTFPVMFPPNKPFLYVNGAKVTYFDADSRPVSDSTQARRKQVSPLDSAGFPSNDIIVYKGKGNAWKEEYRLPLIRQPNIGRTGDGRQTNAIGYQNSRFRWEGLLMVIDNDGNRVQEVYYQNEKPVGDEFHYHINGAVSKKTEHFDEKVLSTTWYDNGQIRQVMTSSHPPDGSAKSPFVPAPDQITAFWDGTGRQLVKDGNGRAVYQTREKIYTEGGAGPLLTEQGNYENGFRQGIWTGQYADGSYFYEERYEKGLFQEGKAVTAGTDTVRYTVLEQPATFVGGIEALGKFLAQNLRYPADAQRARVQGRVFISFVINTDGSVADVIVVKGLGFGTEEEAMRVVKATTGRWKPGVQRGRPVRVKYSLPINFTVAN
ncbi:TonB family protein [Spirosoma spitsbergense]|uniref:TonB family protein n=1 Tax=Spirosoma spitsbergense TaxID=431554 RepID=UPI000375A07B|nr:TonB family protein [Spirosoma spitsbergense]